MAGRLIRALLGLALLGASVASGGVADFPTPWNTTKQAGAADPDCNGDYGCKDGKRYRCTIDAATKSCKWQSAAGACSPGDKDPKPGEKC